MAAKFPASLPTADDWSTGNAGMGRTKTNKTSVNNLDHNFRAEEYNQQNLEIIALATKQGIDLSEPASYGDDCLGSHDEILRFLTTRGDRQGWNDPINGEAWPTPYMNDVGAVAAFAADSNVAGCAAITLAAGVDTGFTTTSWLFRQRYMYARFYLYLTLPSGVADYIKIGVYRDATHYTHFYSECTNAVGPVWDPWECEVNDGGSIDTETLTATPVTGTFNVFEILTTTTGATFWLDRGTASEEKAEVTGQAPENGTAKPYAIGNSAAGGETFKLGSVSCWDTRSL